MESKRTTGYELQETARNDGRQFGMPAIAIAQKETISMLVDPISHPALATDCHARNPYIDRPGVRTPCRESANDIKTKLYGHMVDSCIRGREPLLPGMATQVE